MPRKSEGARLYLRKRAGREAIWVIRDGGNEESTGCGAGDRKGANLCLAEYIKNHHRPSTSEKDIKRIRVSDVISVYLTEHAPKTQSERWLKDTAAKPIEWWGDKYLSQVNVANCERYVLWRVKQGVSDQTARHELKTMRTAIHHYNRAHGPLNAMPVVTLPAPSQPREDYFWTRKQTADRLRAARRRKRSRHVCRMIIIGFYSGTRPGATLRLQWHRGPAGGYVDLEAGIIRRAADGARQSKKRQPKARIHYRLLAHLKRWKRLDARDYPGCNLIVHYYGKPVQDVRSAWESIAIEAGHATLREDGTWLIPDGPHVMRHTAATWLMQDSIDPVKVAGFIGMSLETLLKVYGHHHPDYQDEAATARGQRKKGTAPASPQLFMTESGTDDEDGAVIPFKKPENGQ